MTSFKTITRTLSIPAMLFLGACCCNKPVAKQPAPVASVAEAEPAPALPVVQINDIFFDFDRSSITPDSEASLKQNAEWMSANSDKNITLQGHCDERGTAEYNMALGERRAQSAKEYLMSLGVDSARMTTISYGEEQPFDPAHNEAAWAKNRRVHFVEE